MSNAAEAIRARIRARHAANVIIGRGPDMASTPAEPVAEPEPVEEEKPKRGKKQAVEDGEQESAPVQEEEAEEEDED